MRYDVPAQEIFAANIQARLGTDELGTGVLAFDYNGEVVARKMMKVTLGVDQRKVKEMPNATLDFSETVDLPSGHSYLYLGLWDMTTGRFGAVNAQVEVKKP